MPNSNFVALDSTEIFEGSSWTNVTPLSRQEYGLKGVSLRNIVYMIGESSYLFFFAKQSFEGENELWTFKFKETNETVQYDWESRKLLHRRRHHAVTIASLHDLNQYCLF